jgi:cell division protein FtsI/penicillin-binding protein 2
VVANRRLGPLIVLVVLGFFALFLRLYQVQVEEHDIWAREAANLVRSAHSLPYLRGRILDRNGQPFVQDEESYAVRFVYREFRRHHPLGQVAHARGALEGRHTGLPLAALNLETWGLELAESRAADLERFARGEALRLCGLDLPAVAPGTDRRRSRASEVRFYIHGLLGTSRRAWDRIRKDLRKGRGLESTWIELVARQEELPVEFVRARLRARLVRALERLEQLAVQLQVHGLDGTIPVTAEESLWFLIDALEVQRRAIEDAIAGDLFLEATGFEAGRVEPELLLDLLDLEFVSATLGWDPARSVEWAHEMRRSWLEARRTFHVPRAQVSARLRADAGEDALEALFGELAVLFAPKPRTPREARARSRDWRAIEEAAVFAELPDLFAGVELLGRTEAPLPFLEPGARGRAAGRTGWTELAAEMIPIELAGVVALQRPPRLQLDWRGNELEPWRAPADRAEAARRLLGLVHPELETSEPSATRGQRDDEELLRWIENLWEAHFQSRLALILERVRRAAREADYELPLRLDPKRLERAEKKADYFIRDRGSRPARLDESPDDDVVNTLTRYVEEYQGFEVEPRTYRVAMATDADGVLVARELIGVVRESTLEEVLEQQGLYSVFDAILPTERRAAEDEQLAKELVNSLYRADEMRGTSGVEGLMDDVLRGRNGFVEQEGLQQREEGTRSSLFMAKEDGRDVELTLSLELQMAAQATLENPNLPREEEVRDEYWFQNPVGAIVLATVEGEILAAASCPKEPHEPSPARDGERGYNYERTLRMPLFQPLGSIFKPFVAAYALSRRGLEPGRVFECNVRPSGTAGWERVACHNPWGHGALTLDEAIEKSCNAYFAQVGELLEDKDHVRELAHLFGFDRPSGVCDVGRGRGLFEVHRIPSLHEPSEFSRTDLHRAGNGLAVIVATPVQVARAVAGLATGRLPRMRLVRSVDGAPLPATFENIALPEQALQFVRDAMRGVITTGSALGKGLSRAELGFALAGKTGSADYSPMTPAYLSELRLPPNSRPQMRKHTWFIGYFPAESPTTVVVVYCHDIGVTASHSAVHVAAQFLGTPEVQAYARGAIR